MRLAFALLRYTAQRPGDMLAMTWGQYNGETIRLRQQKTRKLLEVACHRELRAILDEAKPQATATLIVARRGRPVSYPHFLQTFNAISALANVAGLQPRDLRRTAVLAMAEAGATEGQIASVTGHSIETTRQILDVYMPRTVELSRAGIRRWEGDE